MTWNHNGQGIITIRPADCSNRQGISNHPGNLTISSGLAIGNVGKLSPNRHLNSIFPVEDHIHS